MKPFPLLRHACMLTAAITTAVLLCGCKDDKTGTTIKGTSYTLESGIANGVFSLYPLTITFLEYNTGDTRVDSNKVYCPEKRTPYTYAANEAAHHLKIRLDSDKNTHRWVDSIFTLIPDKNITIAVDLSINDLLDGGGSLRQTEPMLNE